MFVTQLGCTLCAVTLRCPQVSFLNRLATLVTAFVYAVDAVSYLAVLLVLYLYMFGILSHGFFGESDNMDRRVDDADLSDLFGTVLRSMATLFQLLTFDMWIEQVVGPISDEYPVAWGFFIFVVVVSRGGGVVVRCARVMPQHLPPLSRRVSPHRVTLRSRLAALVS